MVLTLLRRALLTGLALVAATAAALGPAAAAPADPAGQDGPHAGSTQPDNWHIG